MKNLERAIRVYRALAESPVKVDSSSLRSWPHIERALSHAPTILTEMRGLATPVRTRVMAYVGEFAPLVESRPIFQMPDGSAVREFIKEVAAFGGQADHIDNGGLVAATGMDMAAIESVAARLGGVQYKGPKLADAFESVDTTLPETLMRQAGLTPAVVEEALIKSLYAYGNGKKGLAESRLFAGFKMDGALDRFKDRLATFARPKPVLGVSRRLAEAVRAAGMATPDMLRLMEAGDPPGGAGVSGGNSGVSAPGSAERGGIAKDQPDSRGSSPANSRNGEQKAQTPPTEHVPSQEQGGATNAIRLPDGTEVPMDTLRQAFAKMLHNMATQVEQGSVGGAPTPRGADQQDATGAQPPKPSVPQQQVAAQSASQQAAGNGAEPAAQPAQANGQPPAPEQGAQAAPPPANGQPGQAAPGAPEAPAPGQPPAAPGQPPAAGGGDIEGALAKAEQGDAEALKQVQGMQGQMSDEQKQRLQAILAKQQGGNGGPSSASPPAQESYAAIRRALSMLESVRERDLVAGLGIIRDVGLAEQPARVVERVRNKLMNLALHESPAVRAAVREAASPKAQKFVGGEISKLMKKGPSGGPQKGKPFGQKQAVAAALNVAREKGYKVGAKPNEGRVRLGEAHSRTAYARTGDGQGFVVWEEVRTIPAGVLPSGLSYGTNTVKPGTPVAIMESGSETCVVRLPSGDVVRAPKVHVMEDAANGYLADQRVMTCSLSSMMEALAKDGVKQAVVVAGSPTSGRGFFIRTKLAPWARRMQERVSVAPFPSLESATGAEAHREAVDEMRLATAREDHAALSCTKNEAEFDRVLVSDARFRHVTEGQGLMLRDSIPWKLFQQQCRESFDRYYSVPAVRRYYTAMGSGRDKIAEAAVRRMVSERRVPAFVQMGAVLVVDAPPRTNITRIAEAAVKAGLTVTLVEMRLDLATTLGRGKAAKLRESRLAKSYNVARMAVDEARRSPNIARFVTYTWRSAGGPFEGRFVSEADVSAQATVTKKDIDGEQGEIRPKSMAVPVIEGRVGRVDPVNAPRARLYDNAMRHVHEQLDVGQAGESESCASGMKEAGEQLKAAREAVFKLTTSTLVQCASMAQATGAKRTQREIDKAQQLAATFLDDLKALAAQVDKANEAMKGENGGMGGDNVDAMKQMAAANGNGDAAAAGAPAPAPAAVPPAAPVAGAAPAPAAPAPPMESITTADAAVAALLDTPIAERIARGEDYRSLNEAILSYMPHLDVRERVEAIDRIKAVLSVPADASLRVQFNPVDHRMLTEAVPFGSLAGVLVARTRGGTRTLASTQELQHAISALRKHGKSAHAMLANTLESAVGGRGSVPGLNEFQDMDRAGAKSMLVARDRAENWKLNVSRITVDRAMTFAEETYARFGGDFAGDLPDMEKNFALLKAKMKYAQDIPRIDMPVIEPTDLGQFSKDLEAGRVDIFQPWAAEHIANLFPWERQGKPPMFGDKEWVTLGVRDGDPRDDVVNTAPQMIPVKNLKPLQNEIWLDKLVLTCAAFGAPRAGSPILTKGVIIVSSDGYILDGHHRFGQVYLADPGLSIKCLKIDLDLDTLLKVSRSYGSAIGNKAKR